jgi:hypothetical protein
VSRIFHVTVEPKTDDDIAALGLLANHVSEYAGRHGNRQCATLCQIKFRSDGSPTLNGRLYTGAAADYLEKHIRAAMAMQDAEDKPND